MERSFKKSTIRRNRIIQKKIIETAIVAPLLKKFLQELLIKAFLKLYSELIARCILISFILAKAEFFKDEGNDKFRKKDFSNAILLYTEGIKVHCKDEELKAKLYSNRATAHFTLGEKFLGFHNVVKLVYFHKFTLIMRSTTPFIFFSLIFAQVTSMIHLVMQRLPRTYNRLMSRRLLEVKSHLKPAAHLRKELSKLPCETSRGNQLSYFLKCAVEFS